MLRWPFMFMSTESYSTLFCYFVQRAEEYTTIPKFVTFCDTITF